MPATLLLVSRPSIGCRVDRPPRRFRMGLCRGCRGDCLLSLRPSICGGRAPGSRRRPCAWEAGATLSGPTRAELMSTPPSSRSPLGRQPARRWRFFRKGRCSTVSLGCKNPTSHINFMPVELMLFDEDRIVECFQAHPPDLIALVHKDTSEIGISVLRSRLRTQTGRLDSRKLSSVVRDRRDAAANRRVRHPLLEKDKSSNTTKRAVRSRASQRGLFILRPRGSLRPSRGGCRSSRKCRSRRSTA